MTKELDHKFISSLVIRLQNGDTEAFTQIYGMTYNKVYNYARHYLRDEYLAQDAVQEVFILALKNISTLKDSSLFVAWLNQISFHVCFDICKKNSNDYGSIADPELLEILRDDKEESNPASHTELEDEKARLRKAIDALPIHEKQCIILRYYNDMKIDEIVSTLGFSKSSVKRYLISGRDHLAELFSNSEGTNN